MTQHADDVRWQQVVRTKSGERIYRRGITIIHRCMPDRLPAHSDG